MLLNNCTSPSFASKILPVIQLSWLATSMSSQGNADTLFRRSEEHLKLSECLTAKNAETHQCRRPYPFQNMGEKWRHSLPHQLRNVSWIWTQQTITTVCCFLKLQLHILFSAHWSVFWFAWFFLFCCWWALQGFFPSFYIHHILISPPSDLCWFCQFSCVQI